MRTKLEELALAFLREAEKLKPALMAKADALGKNIDLGDFRVAGDASEFITATVELQGTLCRVGITRETKEVNWIRLEMIVDGIAARHVTFEMEEVLPEEVRSVQSGDW